MWTGLYSTQSISHRLPCANLTTACNLGCFIPDNQRGNRGSRDLSGCPRLESCKWHGGRPSKPALQWSGLHMLLPSWKPCAHSSQCPTAEGHFPPSLLFTFLFSPPQFWSSLSCQSSYKAEFITFEASIHLCWRINYQSSFRTGDWERTSVGVVGKTCVGRSHHS